MFLPESTQNVWELIVRWVKDAKGSEAAYSFLLLLKYFSFFFQFLWKKVKKKNEILNVLQIREYNSNKSKAPVCQPVNTKCSSHRRLIFERPFLTEKC